MDDGPARHRRDAHRVHARAGISHRRQRRRRRDHRAHRLERHQSRVESGRDDVGLFHVSATPRGWSSSISRPGGRTRSPAPRVTSSTSRPSSRRTATRSSSRGPGETQGRTSTRSTSTVGGAAASHGRARRAELEPDASPEGRRIVYVTNMQGRPELYIMDSDGTERRPAHRLRLQREELPVRPRLVARRAVDRLPGDAQRAIPDSHDPGKRRHPEAADERRQQRTASWAPDSRHLVFTSTRTGVRQLWVLDTESNRVRQLTKSAGSRLAAWSARLSGQ